MNTAKNGEFYRTEQSNPLGFQPSGNKTDILQKFFCVLNLRGDALEFIDNALFLCKISSLIILMLDTKSLKTGTFKKLFDRCKNSKSKFVLCFVTSSYKKGIECENEWKSCCEYADECHMDIYAVISNWTKSEFLNMDIHLNMERRNYKRYKQALKRDKGK